MLNRDQIIIVRYAVAAAVPAHQPRLKARIRDGDYDHCPLMTAGLAAAERVLAGLFE